MLYDKNMFFLTCTYLDAPSKKTVLLLLQPLEEVNPYKGTRFSGRGTNAASGWEHVSFLTEWVKLPRDYISSSAPKPRRPRKKKRGSGFRGCMHIVVVGCVVYRHINFPLLPLLACWGGSKSPLVLVSNTVTDE